jgi:hypothetical protein
MGLWSFVRANGGDMTSAIAGYWKWLRFPLLGHLMAPYDETPAKRRKRIERIGVPLWQEDLWKEIIRAAESGPFCCPFGLNRNALMTSAR